MFFVLSAPGGCSRSKALVDGGTADGGATGTEAVSVLVGQPNGPGDLDGVGTAARFSVPSYLAEDGAGSIFLSDQNGIRKIDEASGQVTTAAGMPYDIVVGGVGGTQQSCYAGPALYAEGVGGAARFNTPAGIVSDHAGHLYIADLCNNAIRHYDVASQTTSTFALLTDPSLSEPSGVALDETGHLYVADALQTMVFAVSADGTTTPLAGSSGASGSADGTGTAAMFTAPRALVADGHGSLYVTDQCAVRRITVPAGVVTTLAGSVTQCGSMDGVGTAARLGGSGASSQNRPSLYGLAYDGTGALYVASGDATIKKIVLSTGVVTTAAGSPGVLGAADGTKGTFDSPTGVAVVGQRLYVSDTGNDSVRTVDLATGAIATAFGSPPLSRTGLDGKGSTTFLTAPGGLATDSAGNLFLVDSGSTSSTGGNTVRKVDTSGNVTTLAGKTGETGSADGKGAAARFDAPSFLVEDGAGSLYVTDTGNDTIRKIDAAGNVTTFAGTAGQIGTNGDGIGASARFDAPLGITRDDAGHLFVADSQACSIRQIDLATATVTTPFGSTGVCGHDDGAAAVATFGYPTGIVYLDGALYVSDDFVTIRKIDLASKSVTTFAGAASSSGGTADGIGAAASFNSLQGLATDGQGTLYAADQADSGVIPIGGSTVRKIVVGTAQVTTLLGSPGQIGVRAGTLSTARFNQPMGLAFSNGHLFVSDAIEGVVVDAVLAQ